MSAAKPRALGEDALDGLIPLAPPGQDPGVDAPEGMAPPPTPEPPTRLAAHRPYRPPRGTPTAPVAREKITFALPRDLVEACRNAADFLSGPPTRLTLAALVERALRREVDRLQREHRQGEAFPPREGPLRTGRPLRR
jgi:hypothetical protein